MDGAGLNDFGAYGVIWRKNEGEVEFCREINKRDTDRFRSLT